MHHQRSQLVIDSRLADVSARTLKECLITSKRIGSILLKIGA